MIYFKSLFFKTTCCYKHALKADNAKGNGSLIDNEKSAIIIHNIIVYNWKSHYEFRKAIAT